MVLTDQNRPAMRDSRGSVPPVLGLDGRGRTGRAGCRRHAGATAGTAQPAAGKAPAAVARTATPARPKFRKLAPNAMRTVDPERQLDEGYDRHDVTEILSADPTYAERAVQPRQFSGQVAGTRYRISP